MNGRFVMRGVARGLAVVFVAAGLSGGAGFGIALPAAYGQGGGGEVASFAVEASRVAAWSDSVWGQARSGMSESALDLLERLPEGLDELGLGDFEASVERFRANIASREASRSERIGEVRDELSGYPVEIDEREALSKVLELHTLSLDESAVLGEGAVSRVISDAEARASRAERDGEWLTAHYLVSRLNALFDDGRYRDDLNRLNRRILMLSLYVPERLHEMRSELRVAEGEDALPPYNDIGADWREKLEGINARMLLKSMAFAAGNHVYGASVKDMVLGGLDALVVLVTTTDLASAMPELNDAGQRRRFMESVERRRRSVEMMDAGAVEFRDAVRAVQGVMSDNRLTLGLPDEVILHEFGDGFTSRLDDYSGIIWPDELREFTQQTRGDFHGVGIQISLNDALELEVVAPISGTPAARAGIRAGDVIERIDGEDTTGIALSQAVERITGEKGTEVVLGIRREGEDGLLRTPLIRDTIPLHATKGWRRDGPDERDWDYMVDRENGIGYVRLTRFNEKATSELRSAIIEMEREGLEGLVLDLRSNPGGLLTEAVRVANLFLESGVIVSQEDRSGRRQDTQRARRSGALVPDVPMVVLVNGGSASASEIVAGALKDHERAIVVGERTFGKGSVQNVIPLREGGRDAALKLTTQLYMLPNGESIHRDPRRPDEVWGIEPNVRVEMLPEQISDWLELRRDADVVDLEDGELASEPVDPSPLVEDGIDVQLETALLLLQNRIAVAGRVAELRPGGEGGVGVR